MDISSLISTLTEKHWRLVTAESCTGGLVAATLTDIAGSSAWFEGSFVTYSNDAKKRMLSVPDTVLQQYGAVSEQTAKAMAQGALQHSSADVSIAITGIAGPSGGSEEKPVGMVCFAWAIKTGALSSQTQYFDGDRQAIRHQAMLHAINLLQLNQKD